MTENPIPSKDSQGQDTQGLFKPTQPINLDGVSLEIIETARALLAAKNNIERWTKPLINYTSVVDHEKTE